DDSPTPLRGCDPDRSAECRENEAFGEELTDQARATHAERETKRDLAPARDRVTEEQIRHVGARDEQNDKRDAGDPHDDRRLGARLRPATELNRPETRAWLGEPDAVVRLSMGRGLFPPTLP